MAKSFLGSSFRNYVPTVQDNSNGNLDSIKVNTIHKICARRHLVQYYYRPSIKIFMNAISVFRKYVFCPVLDQLTRELSPPVYLADLKIINVVQFQYFIPLPGLL